MTHTHTKYDNLISQINQEISTAYPLVSCIDKSDFYDYHYDSYLRDAQDLVGDEYWERSFIYMLLILEAIESES